MVALTSASSVPCTPLTSQGKRSYLAPDLIIQGRIECDGVVEIDAAMQGVIQAKGLIIGSKGRVRAAIDADQAVVAGTVEGVLKSRSVTFASGCDFDGDVQYEAIGVEANASVQGGMYPILNAAPRPQNQDLQLAPSAPAQLPQSQAIAHSGQSKPAKPSLSSSRTVLWVVTLLGIVVGALIAAMISAPPPLRQWWAAYQQNNGASTTPAATPQGVPETAPPTQSEAAPPLPASPTPPPVSEAKSTSIPAKAPPAPPVAALTAAGTPPPSLTEDGTKRTPQETAASKRQDASKAAAEKAAAARANAEKSTKTAPEKPSPTAAKATDETPEAAQGNSPPASTTDKDSPSTEGAAPAPTEAASAKKPTSRSKGAAESQAPAAPSEGSTEGSCSWVLRCEGPGNSGCISTRQCD